MASLVSYDSCGESDNEDESLSKMAKYEPTTHQVSKVSDDLEAEWESFEKLISGGGSEQAAEAESSHQGFNVACSNPISGFSGVPPVSTSVVSPSLCMYPVFPSTYPPIPNSNNINAVKTPASTHGSDDMDISSGSDDETDPPIDYMAGTNTAKIATTLQRPNKSVSPKASSNSSSPKSNRMAESSDDEEDRKSSKSKSSSNSSKSDDSKKKMRTKSLRSRSSSRSSGNKNESNASDNNSNDDNNSDDDNSDEENSHRASSDRSRRSSGSVSPKRKSPHLVQPQTSYSSGSVKSDSHRAIQKDSETRKSSSQERMTAKLLALAEETIAVNTEKLDSDRHRRRSKDRRVSPTSSKRNRDHSRDRSRERRRRRSHSRSNSRRRDRHHRSRDESSKGRGGRSSHRRSSRSRSPARRNRHHSRERRRSRDRRHSPARTDRRRPSHRSRSRDRKDRPRRASPPVSKAVKNQPLNFKEQLKAQLMNAQKNSSEDMGKELVIDTKSLMTANEKKSALPLNNPNPLQAMIGAGSKEKVTPQQALIQTMAAMHAKAQELTGVAVPSYYNPAAVNPLKYAEQLKKRKLLWSKNKDKESEKEKEQEIKTQCQWSSTSFTADNDGKMAAKFRKLMGIKAEDQLLLADNVDVSKLTEEQRRRQEELFQQLDREYAFARMTTHTHRGIGLGFQSQGLPDA